jgi:hypothetical protein
MENSSSRPAQTLEREMLMDHPGGILLYLNEFRTYMPKYALGADDVGRYVESGNANENESNAAT